jgi:signal transduction histidine kinase
VDAVRFSQVLRNVLANAMKFSPDGGVIRILIEEAATTLGRRADDLAAPVAAWRITVIDEGIGIPEDELETVFDSFVQSSKTRDGAGGTGLGLTICREIVAAHRGSISARNRPEGGAVFEIMVPR